VHDIDLLQKGSLQGALKINNSRHVRTRNPENTSGQCLSRPTRVRPEAGSGDRNPLTPTAWAFTESSTLARTAGRGRDSPSSGLRGTVGNKRRQPSAHEAARSEGEENEAEEEQDKRATRRSLPFEGPRLQPRARRRGSAEGGTSTGIPVPKLELLFQPLNPGFDLANARSP